MQKSILSSIIILILPLIPVSAQQRTEKTSEGIIHHNIINSADTLVINVLDINLDSCGCTLNTVKANNKIKSLEQTSVMASGDSILAAVNADFFEADGSTINNMMSGGQIIKGVSFPPYDKGGVTYSQFALDFNNRPYIERFDFTGVINANNRNYKISGVNIQPEEGKLILYNLYYDIKELRGKNTFLLKPLYSEDKYLVSHNTASADENDFILLDGAGIILPDTITVQLKFRPYILDLKLISGGWPQLIKDGKNILSESEINERVIPRFSSTKHPRTGIGFSKDSTHIFLFTVDGRQESSSGMSLNDFTRLMLSFGVYSGLNFDGGGSTTMVIKGQVVNHPSDAEGERKVGSAVYVVKKRGTF